MDEIERNARLHLQKAAEDFFDDADMGSLASYQVASLAAAGLTIAPIEPSEERIEEIAGSLRSLLLFDRSLASVLRAGPRDQTAEGQFVKSALRDIARAAYRAGIGRKEG
jgi:hypothetical protein